MKQYILIALLIILITACAPKVEVEEATPTEVPEEVMEEIVLEEPEEVIIEENIIEIKEDSFYPAKKTVDKNTEIKWVKKDVRRYKIGCYLEGTRVIQSPDLEENEEFIYTFLQEGEYTCITTPYGLRSTIIVEPEAPLLSPTGRVVASEGKGAKGASLAVIAVLAIVTLLFFIFGRNRE